MKLKPIYTKDYSDLGIELGYYFNPLGNFSLLPYKEGYLASFRLFGYVITSQFNKYETYDQMTLEKPDEHVFVLLDRDFNFVKRLNLVENEYWKPDDMRFQKTYLEDMRLVNWDGEIYGSSATFYTTEQKWEKMGLEIQELIVEGDDIHARHAWNSCEHGIMGRQKNWMPIPDKPFHYITETYEKGARMIDISSGKRYDGGEIDDKKLLRGNTPLVETDFGYMTITHRVRFEGWRKIYENYLVEFNKDLSIRRVSKPFKLCESGIEFIACMLPIEGDKLAICVTEMDEKPTLMVFNKEEVVSRC